MKQTIEEIELNRFFQTSIQELKNEQISREEGGALEELFTEWAVDLLSDAGETENARIAYDEKNLGTKNQHKINAYSISDNYETIDLFITVFNGSDILVRVAKDEIDTASKRIVNFFNKGINKGYVEEIEESSQIFDFAHTLNTSDELRMNVVRINAIIITDGIYNGVIPANLEIAGFPVYFRVIDIKYLYDISEKSHIPIEINFKEDGYFVPCISSLAMNDEYQSYLAIIPAMALASIYEKFGSRLLEQNVRSFLQFTGKINKGIRTTILKEPHMFLAFNNGIAATADELIIEENGSGAYISSVKDFQIVNGGQTTASLFHTYKKERADITKISVQIKFTVVKNKDNFSNIVSRISEYANTQNKVSIADLSSNKPFHIELEKLSRSLITPLQSSGRNKTRWFYERARGQYRNARIKDGNTVARKKAFDLLNPKNQVLTKEELAKYINSYEEVFDGRRLVIGPHIVVRGNQKNYINFMNYNIPESVDNVYFEDSIAKAILFKSAEKIYGVKPNAIGDLRYLTVPYTIALLGYLTMYKLDLYKIWENQSISDTLKETLNVMMRSVEYFIKEKAPGSLYSEWAKREDCWLTVKEAFKDWEIPIDPNDLIQPDSKARKRISDSDISSSFYQEVEQTVKNLGSAKWKEIYLYCKENPDIPESYTIAAHKVGKKLKENVRPAPREIILANELLNKIIFKTAIFDEVSSDENF
jgi:hypothetical protein